MPEIPLSAARQSWSQFDPGNWITANFISPPRSLRPPDSRANRGKDRLGANQDSGSYRLLLSRDTCRSEPNELRASPDAASRPAPPRPEDPAPRLWASRAL